MNLKDFPADILGEFDIEALHPDEFISDLFDLNHAIALEAVRQQRMALKNPPMTTDEFIDMLLKQGLPKTVKAIDAYKFMI
ncbi:hypothetical protein [Xenorhabdus lircayensis]|uniref:hypothetical protein n=1 Tax=Xenorhabdus lircayensis TaxID=2763499 RepID=UPI001E492874|nr:hypothetical protein [Xenorhabdus lircayensis]